MSSSSINWFDRLLARLPGRREADAARLRAQEKAARQMRRGKAIDERPTKPRITGGDDTGGWG